MLTSELPQQLQEEFERTARLLHDHDSIRQALIEAIELWLAQQRQKLLQKEATANNQAFENLREAIPGLTFVQDTFPEIHEIISGSGDYHLILGLKLRWSFLKISKPGIAVGRTL